MKCPSGGVEGAAGYTVESIFARLVKDRVLFLCQEIDANMATGIVAALLLLDKESAKKEITIYINSIGGSVSDGLFTIYDTFQFIKAPVRTVCIGEAYSSAAVLLASGTKGMRSAYPNSRIMIHSIQVSEMSGSQKEIEEETKRTQSLNDAMMRLISSHTGQSVKKIKRDCEEDLYFTPEEAIEYGLIDFIVTPSKKILSPK